jgi:lysophospholipase
MSRLQPFNGIKPDTFEDSNSTWLELIDGASNLENVPLGPMFVRARNVDFVIAVDGSANTPQGWPKSVTACLLFPWLTLRQ